MLENAMVYLFKCARRLLSLAIVLCIYFTWPSTSNAADSYVVAVGDTVQIDEHGVCQKITNNAAGGIMVPTKSAEEWHTDPNSFLENLYTDVTAAACGGKMISSGGQHACAIGADSKAYCWGYNTSGQLGNGKRGASESKTEPVLVLDGDGPGTYIAISAGSNYSCAIGTDNKAYCWGRNGPRMGAGGGSGYILAPQSVLNGEGPGTYTSVDGTSSVCAIGTDNKAYCWGSGNNGTLGNGTTSNASTPVLVHNGASPGMFKSISTGSFHVCAIGTNDKAYCWGRNYSNKSLGPYAETQEGRLGDGTSTNRTEPVLVLDGDSPGTFLSISAGGSNTCAMGADTNPYCWGDNAGSPDILSPGRLSDGTTIDRKTPVLGYSDQGSGTFLEIALGSGLVSRSGWNVIINSSQYYTSGGYSSFLGTNQKLYVVSSYNGTLSLMGNGEGPGTFSTVTERCGLATDEKFYCWGRNNRGQLGNGMAGGSSITPVLVHTGDGLQ